MATRRPWSRSELPARISHRSKEAGRFFEQAIGARESREILRPEKLEPDRGFLARHRQDVFPG